MAIQFPTACAHIRLGSPAIYSSMASSAGRPNLDPLGGRELSLYRNGAALTTLSTRVHPILST